VFDGDAEIGDGAEPAVDADLMNTVCACATSLLDTLKPEYADAQKALSELRG